MVYHYFNHTYRTILQLYFLLEKVGTQHTKINLHKGQCTQNYIVVRILTKIFVIFWHTSRVTITVTILFTFCSLAMGICAINSLHSYTVERCAHGDAAKKLYFFFKIKIMYADFGRAFSVIYWRIWGNNTSQKVQSLFSIKLIWGLQFRQFWNISNSMTIPLKWTVNQPKTICQGYIS